MFARRWNKSVRSAVAAMLVSLSIVVPARAAVAAPHTPATPPAEKIDHDGHPVTGRAWTQQKVKDTPVSPPVWPKATTARAQLPAVAARSAAATRRAQAGTLPVWIADAPGASSARLSSVDVQVIDRATVPAAWHDGLVMRVTAPNGANAGAARLSVDYRSFQQAYGADWVSRLKLWRVPQCALTTPNAPGCRSVVLPTTSDPAGGTATATVSVASATATQATTSSFVALAAAPSGKDGDFSATSLSASATWSAGGNSGEFSWNYPMRMPPAAGPSPNIALSYSSSSVDGRSEVTNNQPSWVGEGFDVSPGYVERRYVPCFEDSTNGANSTKASGDLCWRSDNATLSFGGHSGELIYQAGKGWHLRSEDGSRIEKLTGAANGDAGDAAVDGVGEYWRVTTTDGTQYYFGLDDLPGQSSGTNSTLTVPVFGNHSGEPCHQSAFTSSDCAQAWRWNLDYVVDVHGNTMSLWYGKETNKYAQNGTDADDVTYDRAGYLTRIDYGTYDRTQATHGVTERSTAPYAQVVFETDMRCFTDCGTEAAPTTANWKDTPWDQECKASATSCPGQYSPTFWTTKRLKKVTTRVWDTTAATPGWQDVESWTLSHTFSATADSTHTGLWLERIDHSGLVGTEIKLPPVTFEAVSLANRVLTENGTTNDWLRIASIVTETGARIKVDYSEPECTAAMVENLAPESNTHRCYPVKVPDSSNPNGDVLVTQWWHKYVVAHVAEDDLQTTDGHPAPTVHTRYTYVGVPAWHYADDDGLSKPAYKTWDQWRGYAEVDTQVGDETDTRTLTTTKFLRGMNGDRAAPSGGARTVTVPASYGSETVYDEDQFAGMVREQDVYNGVDTKPVSRQINVPWRSGPTASRTINGDTVEARYTDTQTTYAQTALGVDGSRGWRTTSGHASFDPAYGTVNWSQDDGDVSKTGDEQCVTYTYNRNTDKNLTTTVSRALTTALTCGTTPSTVDDVIGDMRSYYDGATSLTTPPAFGSVTQTDQLKDWTAATGTVWQTVSQATYDSTGRVKTAIDIKGNTTETTYTPVVGGPVTTVTTKNPLGWPSTADANPYWGSVTKTTDPNSRITADVDYDALGRVSRVWKLGWTRATNPGKPASQYEYVFAPNRDAYPFVKSQTLNADGNYVTSYQISDALLRPRQTQSLSLGGSGDRVVTDMIYDEFGRTANAYGAHAEPGAPSGALWWEPEWSVPSVNKNVYDRAGRVTDAIFLSGDGVTNLVEKWRTTTAYEGDLTKVTPPQGGTPTTTVTDSQGRVVALREHTTAAGVNGAYTETEYTFNRKDQQVKVTDTAANEWTNVYDPKGHLIQKTDPDSGTSLTSYNDFNEVESTTDARGEKLWFTYDTIGRTRTVRDDSATGALRAEWRYDSLYSGQTGFRGQLTQSIRYEPAGSANAYKWQARGLNNRYQPNSVNYVIPAVETGLNNTYIYEYTYADATGTPTSISYPAGGGLPAEQLTTDYDATTGLPTRLNTSITGSDSTMATTSYTAYGERSSSIYKMPGVQWAQDLVYRDEGTRRVTRTTVNRETVAGTVSDLNYTYDPAGNITSVDDKPAVGSADKQCFRTDSLGRLATAWTPNTTDCATDPTVANLAGPAPYWQDWTFDATGSRLTETSHATAGNTLRTYAVPTGGQGVVGPHTVSAMTTTAPGQAAATTQYRYDGSGNMTCRPLAGSTSNDCGTNANSQTQTWDAEGKLATVTTGATALETNVYDADGTRLIRRDATATTLFLPGEEIRKQGSVTTGTRYYSFAGTVFASRTGSSAITALTWLFNDHQGTQQIAVNAGTQAVTIRRQTPYGSPRGSNPTWVNGKGFVGGDNDPTGLLNIGARQYDQLLGRFISVDPIQDLADPQQWNGYAYSNNNPVTNSDPTGLVFDRNTGCNNGTNGANCSKSPYPSPPPSSGGHDDPAKVHLDGHGRGSVGGVTVTVDQVNDISKFGRQVNQAYDYFHATWGSRWDALDDDYKLLRMMDKACELGKDNQCTAIYAIAVHQALNARTARARHDDPEQAFMVPIAVENDAGAADASAIGRIVASNRASMHSYSMLEDLVKGVGAACVRANSFTPDTLVVLADGTTKPIAEIQIGDKVLATDPETGVTRAEKVTALHTNTDTELVDLTVKTKSGGTAIVHTTAHHPFWSQERKEWVDAANLTVHEKLAAPIPLASPIVGAVHSFTGSRVMYNLTVDDLHTYYVLAGTTPVLVHNTGCWSTTTEKAGDLAGKYKPGQSTRDPASQWYHEELSNDELLNGINNAAEGDGIVVSRNGTILGGHHRWDELQTRIADGRISPDTEINIQVYGGE